MTSSICSSTKGSVWHYAWTRNSVVPQSSPMQAEVMIHPILILPSGFSSRHRGGGSMWWRPGSLTSLGAVHPAHHTEWPARTGLLCKPAWTCNTHCLSLNSQGVFFLGPMQYSFQILFPDFLCVIMNSSISQWVKNSNTCNLLGIWGMGFG